MFVLPCILTETVFVGAVARNVKFMAYVFPLANLHGALVQPVTSNAWIEPTADPQSLNGVAVHMELIEQENTARMNNVNIFLFYSQSEKLKYVVLRKFAEAFYVKDNR